MRMLRATPGLIAFGAFFLPWIEGSGPLAGITFSGYELVGYTGAMQRLETVSTTGLVLAQVAILMTAVAATWLAILAIVGAWRPLQRICSSYVALMGVALTLTGLGEGTLQVGAIVTLAAGMAFVGWELAGPVSRPWRRVPRRVRVRRGRASPVAV